MDRSVLEAPDSWNTDTEAINEWLFAEEHTWAPLCELDFSVQDSFVSMKPYRDIRVHVDISVDTITVAGRAMRVLLMTHLGKMWRQPFYQSSGYNSGMPGTWLPFFGLSVSRMQDGMMRGWFRKYYVEPITRALIPTCGEYIIEHERYGCREMMMLSKAIEAYLKHTADLEEIAP